MAGVQSDQLLPMTPVSMPVLVSPFLWHNIKWVTAEIKSYDITIAIIEIHIGKHAHITELGG